MTVSAWLRASPAMILLSLAACAGEPPALEREVVSRSAEPPHRARAAAPGPGETGRSFRAEITAKGVTVAPSRGEAWAFEATPRGFGCDGALDEVGGAAPVEREGRVEYARPGLREWYVDGPRGLEQGFTIPAPPACRRRGGRGVVIALGGGLGAAVSEDGRAARLHDAAGTEVLRYTDLRAVDAAGRELPARLQAAGQGLAIRIDDTGARYPVEVDPLMWAQQQVLIPANTSTAEQLFGFAVSVSGDTALVGAPGAGSGELKGAAHVFVRSGAIWNEQQELLASDGANGADFGRAVSVSGNTALVGAPIQDQGAVYVFTRAGGSWTQTQEIASPDPTGNTGFGTAVAMQGNTAVVGEASSAAGAAYVYGSAGGTWTQVQALTDGMVADGGGSDQFGAAVALDGDTVIVGAPGAPGGNGAAYVFVLAGGTWTLQAELTASDGAPGDQFGGAVAIAGDTAMVGAVEHGGGGVAYVFVRSGATWTQTDELAGPGATDCGASVALRSGVAVVACSDYEGISGAVYAYPNLAPPQMLLTGVAEPYLGGSGLAMDGTTLIAGTPDTANEVGVAFVFILGSVAGDACTSADTCFSGFCVDGVCCGTASCLPAGPCSTAETCQPGTGTCSGATPINEGTACDAGPCTSAATCHGGICTGDVDVCAPVDECHDFGACDPASNTCSSPAKADGLPCSGGTCKDGVCVTGEGGGGDGGDAGGCGCDAGGSPPGGALLAGVALLLLARRRVAIRPGFCDKAPRVSGSQGSGRRGRGGRAARGG